MDSIKTLCISVAFLLAVATGILTLMGGGDGAWSLKGIQQVPLAPDRVFEWLSEPARRTAWMDGLERSSLAPGERLQKGSRVSERISVDGRLMERELVVTEYVPGSRFAFRTTEDGVEIHVQYEIGPHNTSEQSRIDYEYTVQFPGWYGRVAEPLLGRAMRNRIRSELARLSVVAEDGR